MEMEAGKPQPTGIVDAKRGYVHTLIARKSCCAVGYIHHGIHSNITQAIFYFNLSIKFDINPCSSFCETGVKIQRTDVRTTEASAK